MTVVTISRELGCEGRQIAEKVAAQLGGAALDQEVLAEMARQSGVTVEVLAQAEGKLLAKPLAVSDEMKSLMAGRRVAGTLTEAQFIQQMGAAIKILAQQSNVVFVGRAAQIILKEHPQALHVHLYAPAAVRAARIQQRRNLPNLEAALRAVQVADDQRRNWYRHFFSGVDWKNAKHYHLMIDTGRIAPDLTVSIIVQAAGQGDSK